MFIGRIQAILVLDLKFYLVCCISVVVKNVKKSALVLMSLAYLHSICIVLDILIFSGHARPQKTMIIKLGNSYNDRSDVLLFLLTVKQLCSKVNQIYVIV